MTAYDPLSYGKVPLGGADPAAPPENPDDMLFAAGATPRPLPPSDSSWALLEENVDQLLPGGGGAAAPRAAAPAVRAEPAPAREAAPPQRRPAAAPSPGPAATPGALAGRVAGAASPGAAGGVRPDAVRRAMPIMIVNRSPAQALMPAGLLVAGAGAAAWLHFGQHNTVLAAIVGAAALVAAAFAFVLLRR